LAKKPREKTEVELWPSDGEERADFMSRCTEALTKCIGSRAAGVCAAKWNKSKVLGKKSVTFDMLDGDEAIEPCGDKCLACAGADAPFVADHIEISREEIERAWEREWDESKHPRVPAGSSEGGQFGHGGGGGDEKEKPASTYDPADVERFKELKSQWSKLNNDLLDYVEKPDGPETRERLDKIEALTKELQGLTTQMHGLHADPGTPAGIGFPGGPRDVVVVGAGPGGMAASINGAYEGLDTLLIEANAVPGGQAKKSSRIENFGGFPIGVSGERLTQNMFQQATRLGAEAKLGVSVTGMTVDASGMKTLTLSNGEKIVSRAVILAGGVEFRKLTFPGSEGSGVFIMDGGGLAKAGRGGNVCVIGGSNGAAQAALGCAKGCQRVFLLARTGLDNMSENQVTALRNNPKITIIEGDEIKQLNRDASGNIQGMETKKGQVLDIKALGEFIGGLPNTKWLPSSFAHGKGGSIPTDDDMQTSIPGVYAVGDMREGSLGRVGVAYGDGQFALAKASGFLQEQFEKYQAAKKADKPKKNPHLETTIALISQLFDLDRDNPWQGQTIEGVEPLEPPKKKESKAYEERKGDWDEAKHPRVPSGQHGGGEFASGSGGGGKEGAPAKPKDAKHPGKGYSPGAWEDAKGVIHTSNVYDAQRALFEDRKVELTQIKQVSTLIKRLGETAAEMAEAGEQAPVFNLCNVSVEGTNLFCAEQIGIPRVKMPVIPAKRTKDFVNHLKSLGYETAKSTERGDYLRATQSEIDGAKVAVSMKRIRKEGFYKRLVVSRDNYILDGHHTWAAQLGVDAEDNTLKGDKHVKITRVDIPIIKLIEIADAWTKAQGIAKKPAGQKSYAHITLREAKQVLPPAIFAKYYDTARRFLIANPHFGQNIDDMKIAVETASGEQALIYKIQHDALVS